MFTIIKREILRMKKESKFAFSLLWKYEKRLLLLYLTKHLISYINSILLVWFPFYLLNSLQSTDYTKAIIVTVGLVLWQFILSLINEWLDYVVGVREGSYNDKISLAIYEKATELRFEQLASTEVLEQYNFSIKCREAGSVQGLVSNVFSTIMSMALVFSIIHILRDFSILILVAIILVIVVHCIGKIRIARYKYQNQEEENSFDRQIGYYVDDMTESKYLKDIRVFSLTNFLSKKYAQAIEGFFNVNKKYALKHIKVVWWLQIVSALERFFIYGYSVIRFFKLNITVGEFSMNISALLQFSSAIDNIFNCIISSGEQMVYLEKFSSFLRLSSDYVGRKPLPKGKGIITFKNVSFKYPSQEIFVLQNINTSICTGDKISIVGHNGAGKTTFIYLLLGLYKPTSGNILYNDVDIEDISPYEYAKLFAPVLQDFNIFKFRILDNIAFDNEPTPDIQEKAWKALLHIGLKEAVESLPEKIESYITQVFSPKGVNLSGGELQKLAIARNLYRDSPIMILDEPTSALSPQSEYEIYSNFNELTESRTVVYISHRLASCSMSNRILVFYEGKIIEEGTHKQLMNKTGYYADLYNSQLDLYDLSEG